MFVIGTISSLLYWLYNTAQDMFWRSFLVTITVKKPDRAWEW